MQLKEKHGGFQKQINILQEGVIVVQKWEYAVTGNTFHAKVLGSDYWEGDNELVKRGLEGWELVSTHSYSKIGNSNTMWVRVEWVFKRPIA